jgi:hypothetical protein
MLCQLDRLRLHISPHPQPFSLRATVYTQVIEPSQNVLRSPPNPQFWGDMKDQSPPELGDLGGQRMLSEVKFDLCAHRSPEGEGSMIQSPSPQGRGI